MGRIACGFRARRMPGMDRPTPNPKPDVAAAADLYRWLAGVFAREATADHLDRFDVDGLCAAFPDLIADPDTDAALERYCAFVAAQPDIEARRLDLASTYGTLFHGVGGPRDGVIPYESAYTMPGGRLFGDAVVAMQDLIAAMGLALRDTAEPADHIAIELELLAQLTDAPSQDAAAATRRRQLLDDHLLVWGDAFCDLCIARDRSGYYALAALVLRHQLRHERAIAAPLQSHHVPT